MKHGLQLLKVHALFSILVLLTGVVLGLHEHDQIISHEFFFIIDAIPQDLFVYATRHSTATLSYRGGRTHIFESKSSLSLK